MAPTYHRYSSLMAMSDVSVVNHTCFSASIGDHRHWLMWPPLWLHSNWGGPAEGRVCPMASPASTDWSLTSVDPLSLSLPRPECVLLESPLPSWGMEREHSCPEANLALINCSKVQISRVQAHFTDFSCSSKYLLVVLLLASSYPSQDTNEP